MGQSVEVVVSELHSAAARLEDAAQRLQDGLSTVDDETTQLLGSGWKGEAASAYGPAWNQWHDGAKKVVEGLQRMSELLTIAGKEYAKTDESGSEALGSTMQGSSGSTGGGGGTAAGQGAGGALGLADGGGSNDLAQQMNLSPQSPPTSGLGESVQPVAQAGPAVAGLPLQAGQAVAGLAQAVAQLVTGLAQQAESGDEEPSAGDKPDEGGEHPEESKKARDAAEGEPDGAAASGEQPGAAPVDTEQRRAPDIQRAVQRPGE